MANEKIREGDPEKRKKKPVAKPPVDDEEEVERPKKKPAAKPPVDDEEEERPRKKKRRAEEEEETDEEKPKKKKRKRDDDDEDGSSGLSALVPVGGSVFALASLWIGVISVILGVVALGSSLNIITVAGIKIPPIVTCLMPMLWPLAILSGGLAFFTQKHKLSYGSIAGNLRAVIGILAGLGAMGLHGFLVFLFFKGQ